MSATHSAAIAQSHFLYKIGQKQLNIPQYHILILAWSALVILYGETGLSIFRRTQRKNGDSLGCEPLTRLSWIMPGCWKGHGILLLLWPGLS